MTELNAKLVADLARLVARYSPEDWKQLLDAFADQRRQKQVADLLREFVAASSVRRENKSSRRREPSLAAQVRERLDEVRVTDQARAELLDDVWLRLRQRDLLPSMTMVRAFAEATGVKNLSPRREKAITELMHQLVEMPADVLQRMTQGAPTENRPPGEEYERWVALILGSDSPKAD